MIQITDQPIDESALLATVKKPDAGAVVLFVGTTRQMTDGRETKTLVYEAHPTMAEKQLHRIVNEAKEKWPLRGYSVVHRTGEVAVGESSIAVAVSSPHRVDAFAAAQWIMDTIKKELPVWKQDYWADGETAWQHPTDAIRE